MCRAAQPNSVSQTGRNVDVMPVDTAHLLASTFGGSAAGAAPGFRWLTCAATLAHECQVTIAICFQGQCECADHCTYLIAPHCKLGLAAAIANS
jgi:hypothetical protein